MPHSHSCPDAQEHQQDGNVWLSGKSTFKMGLQPYRCLSLKLLEGMTYSKIQDGPKDSRLKISAIQFFGASYWVKFWSTNNCSWDCQNLVVAILSSRFQEIKHGEPPDIPYGVETRHLAGIAKVPNLSHYKMMANLRRVTENDNMILLQNEDGFLSSVTWKGHSTTKWRFVFICFLHQVTYLKGTLQHDWKG